MSYDEIYRETGSSNISKATPEWAEKLEQAIQLQAQGDGRPLIHIATELVNASGEQWSKCPNCGSPFLGTRTLCSDVCDAEYRDYLNGAF
jgi:hypothetical protein